MPGLHLPFFSQSRAGGHFGQIGNAPNSAGKKIKFDVTTVFNAYLVSFLVFVNEKNIGKLKKKCGLFPYQICDTGVPG